MKNPNIQFNATALRCKNSQRRAVAGLLIPLLLVCFAVFFCIATAAAASGPITFNGTVSGKIPADMGQPVAGSNGCVFNFYVTNVGSATELGEFTGSSNFIPNVCTGAYTGTFLWVGADGDSISGTFVGQLIPTATQGLFDNTETATITSGTGRFVGATGTTTHGGQVNFATSSFVLPFKGTINPAQPRAANFKGTVSGKIPADMGQPVAGSNGCAFNFYVTNTGSATQLGEFTGASNFIPNVCTGSYTGTFLWIGADGDSISGPFVGQLIPTQTQGVFDNKETATITGCTGRFVGATGTITLGGQVNFATSSFVLPFEGRIDLARQRLGNISTRGVVLNGDNVMIAGFIPGNDSATTDVVIRALGPSLAAANVKGTLADPMLDLRDGNGVSVARDRSGSARVRMTHSRFFVWHVVARYTLEACATSRHTGSKFRLAGARARQCLHQQHRNRTGGILDSHEFGRMISQRLAAKWGTVRSGARPSNPRHRPRRRSALFRNFAGFIGSRSFTTAGAFIVNNRLSVHGGAQVNVTAALLINGGLIELTPRNPYFSSQTRATRSTRSSLA